jgi:hypothetical protein
VAAEGRTKQIAADRGGGGMKKGSLKAPFVVLAGRGLRPYGALGFD